jgi:16S rRNA (cytidine1402-2'-O)-methyltransferase
MGNLYVVATPIGNLSDISARALETLGRVAVIACEDTRTSKTLLARHGITTRTVSLHRHNEESSAVQLIDRLRAGEDVALISDAGTPGVSDPGARLVSLARREGIPVIPVPGANAAIAAWSVSGFTDDRFLFAGFLPSAPTARRNALRALPDLVCLVLYEAPHRVHETVADLAQRYGGAREIVICRELTKKFEESARMRLDEAGAWLAGAAHRAQGEFVLVLGPGEAPATPGLAEGLRVLEILSPVLAPGEAAAAAARITGAPRRELYAAALREAQARGAAK